jgi:hypothetical protein
MNSGAHGYALHELIDSNAQLELSVFFHFRVGRPLRAMASHHIRHSSGHWSTGKRRSHHHLVYVQGDPSASHMEKLLHSVGVFLDVLPHTVSSLPHMHCHELTPPSAVAGMQRGAEPPYGVCLTQAVFIYGAPVMYETYYTQSPLRLILPNRCLYSMLACVIQLWNVVSHLTTPEKTFRYDGLWQKCVSEATPARSLCV